MPPPADLQKLREAIEAIDRKILEQLQARMRLVDRVARSKLRAAVPLRDRLREEQVLGRIRRTAKRLGLDALQVERLYRVVLEMSVSRQEALVRSRRKAPLRVAYQGVEGSYSHLTAQRRYASDGERPGTGGVVLSGCETFREAATAVRTGAADLALLPIENTTAGSINETYDLLAEGGLTISAEVFTQVEHCLLVVPGTTLDQVRTVLSHPQALAQCELFLRSLEGVRPEPAFDTAGAARKVRELDDPSVAAIASDSAARNFGLEVLQRGIQTRQDNFTRFVEVGVTATPCPTTVPCKTSLLLVLEDRPNALGEILQELGRRGINLTKLESRPLPATPWRYRFYLDVQGHAAAPRTTEALEAVRALTTELRVLGTYRQALASPRARSGSIARSPASSSSRSSTTAPTSTAGRRSRG